MNELILKGRKKAEIVCWKYRFTFLKVTQWIRAQVSRSSRSNWKAVITVSQEWCKLFFSEPRIIPWAMAQFKKWA